MAYSQLCFAKRQTLKMHGPRCWNPQAASFENWVFCSESWQGSTCGNQKKEKTRLLQQCFQVFTNIWPKCHFWGVLNNFLLSLQCWLQTNVNKETQKSSSAQDGFFFYFSHSHHMWTVYEHFQHTNKHVGMFETMPAILQIAETSMY